MPNASTLQFLLTLAKGIASQFGPNCEVVVHDLATNDPERSIVAIENCSNIRKLRSCFHIGQLVILHGYQLAKCFINTTCRLFG